MNFKKWVKSFQTAGYNGVCIVDCFDICWVQTTVSVAHTVTEYQSRVPKDSVSSPGNVCDQ